MALLSFILFLPSSTCQPAPGSSRKETQLAPMGVSTLLRAGPMGCSRKGRVEDPRKFRIIHEDYRKAGFELESRYREGEIGRGVSPRRCLPSTESISSSRGQGFKHHPDLVPQQGHQAVPWGKGTALP